MHFAIFGSLGIARHVIQSLKVNKGHSIALVVDEPSRQGQLVAGFAVQPAEALQKGGWDQIIIATMAFYPAIKIIYSLGFKPSDLCSQVYWDPFFLQIEPTTRCNFSCLHCSRNQLPKERKNQDMSLSQFHLLLEKNPSVQRVQLQGLGEPLLHPQLLSMLQLAKEKKTSSSLTTNASLLNPDMSARLFTQIDKLIISLDSLDAEEFSRVRPGGNLETIQENIQHLFAQRPSFPVVFNCVISRENASSIEQMVQYALETRPAEVHLQLAENWFTPVQPGFQEAHQLALEHTAIDTAIIKQLPRWQHTLQNHGIQLTYTGTTRRKGFCWWPFFGMFISVDGYITPCCIRMQPEVFNFGNLFHFSLQDTWYSKPYHDFRQSMFQAIKNNICDYCPF